MDLLKILKEKAIKKGGSIIDKANSYIVILENTIKELLEDRNKLLEENESLVEEIRKLKKQLINQKSLTRENQTLKLLLRDLKKELEEEKSKPTRIIIKEVVREPIIIENRTKVVKERIETLKDLKKAINKIKEESGINTYA